LNQRQPWKIANKKEKTQVLSGLVRKLLAVTVLLTPFLPSTAKIIQETFLAQKVVPPKPLFIRK
jgi:methionyl-tRNA synthetase